MARSIPPGFWPTRTDQDLALTTPSRILTPKPLADSQAANALQSWYMLAKSRNQMRNPHLKLGVLLANTFLFNQEHEPIKGVFSVRLGPDREAGAVVAVFFSDMSCALAMSDSLTGPALRAPFRPIAMPFSIARKVSPSPRLTVDLATFKSQQNLRLYYTHARSTHFLDGDPDKMPQHAQVIYASLVEDMVAWTRPTQGQVRLDAPPGRDWGKDEEGLWYVPPFLRHNWFTPEEKTSLESHLDAALTMLWADLREESTEIVAHVFAGRRQGTGKVSAPRAQAYVRSAKTGARETSLERAVERMLIKALKHPACPVPVSRIVGTQYGWNSAKTRVQVRPAVLFTTHHKAPLAAHRQLAARAHMGAWLTPGWRAT